MSLELYDLAEFFIFWKKYDVLGFNLKKGN
jgi:hypothetical protein